MEKSQKLMCTITGIKGHCSAGHKAGDKLEISCYNSGGLCGFCYHHIFPSLQTYEYGGKMPWWQGDNLNMSCPDTYNLLTLTIEKVKE